MLITSRSVSIEDPTVVTGEIMFNKVSTQLRNGAVAALALLSMVVVFAPGRQADAAVFQRSAKWTADPVSGYTFIPVCVLPDSNVDKSRAGIAHAPNPSLDVVVGHVRDALRSWEQYSSVRFVGWGTCGDPGFAINDHVSLYLNEDSSNSALIGKGELGHQRDGEEGEVGFMPWGGCFSYDASLAEDTYRFDCVEQYAIHEFGHILGFDHEWLHPATPVGCASANGPGDQPLAADQVSADANGTSAYYSPNTVMDRSSIMTYTTACADVNGVRFGSPVPDVNDRVAIMAMYPPVVRSSTQDVGVIPDSSGTCPTGTEVQIYLDNEDDSPQGNDRAGWIGATVSDRNTRFVFCRVDGTRFAKLAATGTPNAADYAVLKLGDDCPTGGDEIVRYFDDEDALYNEDWISGDAGQNTQSLGGTGTAMHLCLFRADVAGGPTMRNFPGEPFTYGVFAGPSFVYSQGGGWVRTDDEDDSNNDSLRDSRGFYLNADVEYAATRIFDAETNTTLGMALVRQNQAPFVAVSVITIAPSEGVPVDFIASSGDLDGDPLTYTWDFGDGTTADGLAPTHTYADDGAFTVHVTATDSGGLSSTASTVVHVGNVAPVVGFQPTSIDEGQIATVIVAVSDVPTDGLHVGVDWGDGVTADAGYFTAGTTSIPLSHRYIDGGTLGVPDTDYPVAVTVSDDGGASTVAHGSVTVHNVPPTGTITFVGDDFGRSADNGTALLTGLPVQLTASASDPSPVDALSATVYWDGTQASAPAPITTGFAATHVYNTAGQQAVTLVVTDTAGASHSTQRLVNVVGPASALKSTAIQLLAQHGANPTSRAFLRKAINDLNGPHGARNRLQAGDTDKVLAILTDTLVQLQGAAKADPALQLDAQRALLVQSSRSIVTAVVDRAAAGAVSAVRHRQIARARTELARALTFFGQRSDTLAMSSLRTAAKLVG